MKLRVLIADDEPLSRKRLRQLLHEEPGIEIVAECADGAEAAKTIREKTPDIVFLDVRMPELDGFGVLQSLSADSSPVVIFVTAHDRYALRAFETRAVDYLLKPFDRERFQKALDRARKTAQRHRENHVSGKVIEWLSGLKARRIRGARLAIKSRGRIQLVKTSEIDWIQAAGNHTELHVGKEIHLLRQKLAAIEDRLPPDQFMRIGRSLIVNADRIKEARPKSHGDYIVVLQDGTRLTSGRTYRKWFQRLLNKPR